MDEKFFEFSNDDLGDGDDDLGKSQDFDDLRKFADDHDMDIDKAINEIISDEEKIERYDLLNMVLVKVLLTKKLWKPTDTSELERSLQKYLFLCIGMAKKWDKAVTVMGVGLLDEVEEELDEVKERLRQEGVDPDDLLKIEAKKRKEAKKKKEVKKETKKKQDSTESLSERMDKNFFRKK